MNHPAGICRFCKGTHDDPGTMPVGLDFAFVNADANRCNKPACILAFEAEHARKCREDKARNKMLRELRIRPSNRKRSWKGQAA